MMNGAYAIRNIIFDMDGTLVNTAAATVPACRETAAGFGLPLRSADEITKTIGYADPEFHYRLYPGVDQVLLDRFSRAVGDNEHARIREMGVTILFAGVQELLAALKKNGFYLAIASTGSREHVDVCLLATGIRDVIDVICCEEPEKTGMVRRILENGPPGEWMMVGDKSKDAEAGRRNGLLTICAQYGFGTAEEHTMFELGIRKPSDLLALLGLTT